MSVAHPLSSRRYARFRSFNEDQANHDLAINPLFVHNSLNTASSFLAKDNEDREDRMTTVAEQNVTSTTFKIPRSATILSDNQPHKVTISLLELKGPFSYTTIPKLAKHAFLRNKSTNQSEFPFLAGKVNVFMDDTFVATSDVKTTNPSEDISLYLGNDPSVVIDFKEVINRENKGFVSKTLSTKYLHEISAKNTKNKPIRLDVFDQLPKSVDGQIKVTVIRPKIEAKEKPDAAFLNSFNNVRWQVTIQPGETWTMNFEYQIEHPCEKQIEFY